MTAPQWFENLEDADAAVKDLAERGFIAEVGERAVVTHVGGGEVEAWPVYLLGTLEELARLWEAQTIGRTEVDEHDIGKSSGEWDDEWRR